MDEIDKEELIVKSIEIEDSKVNSRMRLDTFGNNISWDMSSIIGVTEEVNKNYEPIKTHNYSLGTTIMAIAVWLITLSHILFKYLFVTNPYSNPIDVTIMMGLYIPTFNFALGKFQGHSMNILTYNKNIKIVMAVRVLIGITNNIWLLYSIKMLPLSKTIMIMSTTPLWWAVLGYIFLKENTKKLEIACIFGAWVGIYFLTLNKQDGSNSDDTLLGYLLVISWAWLTAGIFVCLRYLSFYNTPVNLATVIYKYKIFIILCSFMLGCGILAQGVSLWIISDNKSSFLNYSLSDFIIMNIIGLLQPGVQITMFLANKYSLSSQAASINNFENIVTVITDIFLFHYVFVLSDIIGKPII